MPALYIIVWYIILQILIILLGEKIALFLAIKRLKAESCECVNKSNPYQWAVFLHLHSQVPTWAMVDSAVDFN